MPNRAQCCAANLADTLGDWIRHRIKLLAMIVEQQMVVAKVRAAHVPMEVLGFEIDAKTSASMPFIAPAMSWVAEPLRSVGVTKGDRRNPFNCCIFSALRVFMSWSFRQCSTVRCHVRRRTAFHPSLKCFS